MWDGEKKPVLSNLCHYWKNVYTFRWTKLGDEGTKFFHAAATQRYRIDTITSLTAEDGRSVTEHNEKAALLLDDFRKRMGVSSSPTMLYWLDELVQARDYLDSLSRSFSTLDIAEVIKHMPCPWS